MQLLNTVCVRGRGRGRRRGRGRGHARVRVRARARACVRVTRRQQDFQHAGLPLCRLAPQATAERCKWNGLI